MGKEQKHIFFIFYYSPWKHKKAKLFVMNFIDGAGKTPNFIVIGNLTTASYFC